MSTYLIYRIKCTTDDKFEYWTLLETDPAPTTCPTNTAHTIDTGSVVVIKTIADNIVKVREESIETGGNFQCDTVTIDVATGPGVVTQADFTWPIPVSMLDMELIVIDDNLGDNACNVIAPDTIIGVLTATAATGATGIYVNSTVINNSMVGYELNLLNGADNDKLGRILAIDKENSKINIEHATTQSFPAISTYVRQSVIIVKNFNFSSARSYHIGTNKIGGSYLPANVISRVEYTNNDSFSKKFYTKLEYLY